MKTKKVKIRQLIFSALALLSLFTSSIVACACSHHSQKTQATSDHCHQQSSENMSGESPHGESQIEIVSNQVSLPECCRVQPVPRAFAKSESIQIEKHVAALTPLTVIKIVSAPKTIPGAIEFTKPLYLSDSFYNLSPGRAPPRL